MSARDIPKINPFDDNSPASLADEIYGERDLTLVSGRVVARPTPITDIWADIRQPRRAVPGVVRGSWTGDPAMVARLTAAWEQQVDEAAGQPIPTMEILMGKGDGLDVEALPAIAQEWVALARLAASIRAEGLINPISIVQIDNRWLIESGERRWLAYHLLHSLGFEGFGVIPAIRVEGSDYVWRQARENTARRQLNAIGMARQFALLLMTAREEAGQFQYATYEECVPEGGCDRWYYAQVTDGNIHRIPRGMAERIESAMGLGKEQISRYRDLLALTGDNLVDDAIWARADAESWTERTTRDIKDRLPVGNLREVMMRPGWTLDDLRPEKPQPVTAGNLRPENWMGPAMLAESPKPSLPPVSSPPARTPSGRRVELKPGDLVEANGIMSRVEQPEFQRGIPGFMVFQPDLQRRMWYAETALIPLGYTWDEWLASDGEPKSEEPAVSPSSAAATSDKRDSPTPEESSTGRLFEIDSEDGRWAFLQALRVTAQKSGHQAAADAFAAMAGLKTADIPRLRRDDPDRVLEWDSAIHGVLSDWNAALGEMLDMIDGQEER